MSIPNLLSLLRLLMVPLFPVVYHLDIPNDNLYAAGVYFLAACTDVFDGWLARRTGQVTKLGRILDPLADKAMAFTVLLTITLDGVVHWWAIVVIFGKELLMGIGALTLLRKKDDVFSAVVIGKAATVVFFGVCMVLTIFKGTISSNVSNGLLVIAVCMNILSLAYYLYMYLQAERKKT